MASRPVLYLDLMSQPCRAIETLCRMNNIDVERKWVSIGKRENQQPEFLAVNPLGKLPFLVDGPAEVGDSLAILIYLCRKFNVPDHWYPEDLAAQARVNAVLGWHGSTLRAGSTLTLFNRILAPFRGAKGDEHIVEKLSLPMLRDSLQRINDIWLKDSDYVAGNDISIADLQLAAEIDMSELFSATSKARACVMRGPRKEELLEPYPKLRAWLDRVRERCSPVYEEVSETLHQGTAMMTKALQKIEASKM